MVLSPNLTPWQPTLPEGLSLYPFQLADLEAWIRQPQPRALWNANEQGLGKTIDAINCGRECNYGRILVVTLAGTRVDWAAEFARWWPAREAPAVMDKGFTRKNMTGPECFRQQAKLDNPTHIVSPELLPKLVALHADNPGEIGAYDYLVIDETHRFNAWTSKMMKAVRRLRELYPRADFKLLSGTPLGSDPLKAWPWLKISEPKRWGRPGKLGAPWEFRQTYGKQVPNEYAFSGFTYTGVNEAMLPQFRNATAHLIRRVVAKDVAPQLPPMRFELKRYPDDTTAAEASVDWAEGYDHTVMILSHHHAPMLEVEIAFKARGVDYVRLWEEHTRDERVALVESAVRTRRPILATTGLVGTGVNYLADITHWMLAEPTTNMVELSQLAGRFKRLSSKDKSPRIGFLLYREGEEYSAQKILLNTLKTDGRLLKQAADNGTLQALLDGNSSQGLLGALKLLGRSLLAAGDDNPDDEEDEA